MLFSSERNFFAKHGYIEGTLYTLCVCVCVFNLDLVEFIAATTAAAAAVASDDDDDERARCRLQKSVDRLLFCFVSIKAAWHNEH